MSVQLVSEQQAERLLAFAGEVVRGVLAGRDSFRTPDDPIFAMRRPLAIRLFRAGTLRSQSARFEADQPLGRCLKNLLIHCAFGDPRHAPMSSAEWEQSGLELFLIENDSPILAGEILDYDEEGLRVQGPKGSFWSLPGEARLEGIRGEELATRLCQQAGLAADDWTKGLESCRVFRGQRMGGLARGRV